MWGGRREAEERGDMCTQMADSCCCMVELTQHWKAIILQ